MLRAVFAVAFLALLGQATGYWAYGSGGTSCSQPCPDDDEEGRCPANCACCTCCTHPQPVTTVALRSRLLAPPSRVLFHEHLASPAPVDERDIFHVPKPVLA